MTRGSDVAGSASVFAALGDDTRLRLVARLCHDGPMSITRLADGFEMSRQAITKHLRVMENTAWCAAAGRDASAVWQLEQKRLAVARRHLQAISTQWDQTLSRLKKFVERV